MNARTRIRRAFPYLVIAVAGFAIAYVVVFIFVIPSAIVPSAHTPYVQDSASMPLPVDTDGDVQNDVQSAQHPVFLAPPVGPAYTPPAAPVPVTLPDVMGMTLADARTLLTALQVVTIVTYDTSSTEIPNTVLRQSPRPGVKVPEHGSVTLTASQFPPLPDSSGQKP